MLRSNKTRPDGDGGGGGGGGAVLSYKFETRPVIWENVPGPKPYLCSTEPAVNRSYSRSPFSFPLLPSPFSSPSLPLHPLSHPTAKEARPFPRARVVLPSIASHLQRFLFSLLPSSLSLSLALSFLFIPLYITLSPALIALRVLLRNAILSRIIACLARERHAARVRCRSNYCVIESEKEKLMNAGIASKKRAE